MRPRKAAVVPCRDMERLQERASGSAEDINVCAVQAHRPSNSDPPAVGGPRHRTEESSHVGTLGIGEGALRPVRNVNHAQLVREVPTGGRHSQLSPRGHPCHRADPAIHRNERADAPTLRASRQDANRRLASRFKDDSDVGILARAPGAEHCDATANCGQANGYRAKLDQRVERKNAVWSRHQLKPSGAEQSPAPEGMAQVTAARRPAAR